MKKKRHEHHEEHIDETWLIPYADLLTLLLALFIILFASSQIDSKKFEQIMKGLNSGFNGGTGMFEQSNIVPLSISPNIDQKKEDEKKKNEQESQQEQQLKALHDKEMQDLKELQQKLDGYIKDNGLLSQLETKLNEDMLKITIRDNALFQSGSADIKQESQVLAQSITSMLSGYNQYNVEVAGFTDNVPINTKDFQSNWDLSAKRSLNFMKLLMQNGKIDLAHYRSIGYGEYQPIDTNNTAEGRAKNRRVEVNIIRQINAAGTKSFIP
ncbi:chemotaxis protein MotB [Paenibacillus sp. 1_12]|uniref:flagellar motor protein MotB n=1 Tax=Paenibacillus sp. 1_12 TaxID=1566278 RepID=UPI0008DF6C3B|nr:flagellar motor protein MotB [Paenibacillus sp. 1_12]SFL75255.1 chemotaxis protein MotB [Paenibacillus sp. 1_12]